MIERIDSLDGLGLFSKCGKSPDFQRYTLIYGWNGSGKTTLSRLFEALPDGRHTQFASLKYSVFDESTKYAQGSTYPRPVAVFNRHFVKANAPSLDDPEAPSNHIFIVGEKDKELAQTVKEAKEERDSLIKVRDKDDKPTGHVSLKSRLTSNSKLRDKTFTDVARTIAAVGGGKAVRNYTSRDAKPAFGRLAGKELLSARDLKDNLALMGQEVRQELSLIELGDLEKDVKNVLANSTDLMRKTITRGMIEEFDNDQEYADWASEGFRVHSDHEDDTRCMFCGQSMPAERWQLLTEYFNKEYEDIVKRITEQRDNLRICYDQTAKISPVDNTSVYLDLKEDYDKALKLLSENKEVVLAQIKKVGEALNEKLTKLSVESKLDDTIDLSGILEAVSRLNGVIERHNKRSKDFEKSQEAVFKKLEAHYLSEQYDTIKDLDDKVSEAEKQITEHDERINILSKDISDNEAKLRNTKLACAELNELITQLLGRDELQLEDKDTGYYIRRNGDEIATGLSEGEQTTIAFAYFLIMLKNNGNNIKNMLVVVDDPISSLDADAIYRVGSLIKTRLCKAHQLIIMTHNYDLLNHMKKWFEISTIKDNSTMLMVKNPIVSKKRTAVIAGIDPLLSKYESEYHYLFARLLNFDEETKPDDKGTIAGVYHYPNIARKVLECYLSFRTPGKDVYSGLMDLKKMGSKKITSTDIDDVHSFVNSHSHLDTKTGLLQFDLKLAKNGEDYIKKTLEIIENSDEMHYKSMVKAVKA